MTIAGRGGDVEEERGGAVGERLRAGARLPAPRATSRWIPASAVSSPTASTRTRIAESVDDRAGDDAVARALGHGPRLAGDHRLVELGVAVDDLAVGGHARAGPHEHDVADLQLADRDRLDVPSP